MKTVVRGGTIVTATDTYAAVVLIEGETVSAIGSGFNGDTIVDAKGKYVIPGGVDVHTHFDMPVGETKTADDFESGTIAAAFGGTTTWRGAARGGSRANAGRRSCGGWWS